MFLKFTLKNNRNHIDAYGSVLSVWQLKSCNPYPFSGADYMGTRGLKPPPLPRNISVGAEAPLPPEILVTYHIKKLFFMYTHIHIYLYAYICIYACIYTYGKYMNPWALDCERISHYYEIMFFAVFLLTLTSERRSLVFCI